jgi:NAD(P)-dependent dehydrogenase (short-subunit alcohol dehydrogenase family)
MTALTEDPRELYPKPPFSGRSQQPPGFEGSMKPTADHGEESYAGHGKLKGKVALITGADSGIGRAVALAYAREGADVMVSYLSEDEDAQETARWIRVAGARALCVRGDISLRAFSRDLVEQCFNELGGLDILVNNAATQCLHDHIEDIPEEEFERIFRVNVFGIFHLCQAALPRMKPGGVILNTASIQAYQPSPELLAYAATKGAIVTFTKALSDLALKRGVRVNAVAPGPVWTPLIPSTETVPEDIVNFGKDSPMGRPAQPAELAPLYVFLASREASYISAQTVGVTGGKPL